MDFFSFFVFLGLCDIVVIFVFELFIRELLYFFFFVWWKVFLKVFGFESKINFFILNLKIFEEVFCYVKREECNNFFVDNLRIRVVVMLYEFKRIEELEKFIVDFLV